MTIIIGRALGAIGTRGLGIGQKWTDRSCGLDLSGSWAQSLPTKNGERKKIEAKDSNYRQPFPQAANLAKLEWKWESESVSKRAARFIAHRPSVY